ncbi:hypothetical protein SAMN05444405_10453 [Bacteroides luti]|uniref:Por secretion system C-terminal sorting domain-containing protein n=1 Tax=Bacteroides luti TaxID=1297750 RepID=A0A1M4XJN7_9BACE|nr:T9SS type A sorting domain-containing protein [Bacteroides luti]SHE93596.1 hypothetical protein SAMN05444405_10453 [Bacteroides luti]
MKNYTNYISGLLFLLIFAFAGNVSGQTKTVAHKMGGYYSGYMVNNMQKTHVYNTTVYAKPNSNITLSLPSTTTTSPHHYYRWYDYDTDSKSTLLSTTLGTDYSNGRVAYGGGTLIENITYSVPSNITSDAIACDVSANTDYNLSGSTLTEPTLSYRCIYNIRSAYEIADKLKIYPSSGTSYLEEYTIYMPSAKLTNANDNPRVCLKYNADNYFGYNPNNGLVQGGYSNFTLNGASEAFTSTNMRFCYVSPGAAGTSKTITVTMKCQNTSNPNRTSYNTYNIAKFTIYFVSDLPMPYDNLTGGNERRSISYLNNNYFLLSKLDFDYNTVPATAANNMYASPLPWDVCTYGFSATTNRGFDNKVSQWNEYGFYKTANVTNVSDASANYTWYNNSKSEVRDRKYYDSNGNQAGYFLYVDAAETPGIIAKLDIGELCSGTKLFVSAGICSLTEDAADSDPDLNFVFIGVDASGNETELNRYTSGDIPSKTTIAPWYQIFYSFTFNSNIEYSSYRLQIENNCKNTSGGDYAVDDIRIYRSKPSVQASQMKLECGSNNNKVKFRVEYGKLLSTLGLTEVTSGTGTIINANYKILDSSKNTLNYNYNTDTNPVTNNGVVRFSTKFSAMTALTSGTEPPLTYSQTPALAYTETETIDNVTYRYIVFQAPSNNMLKINNTYYLSVANSQGVFLTGICDMISDPFVVVRSSTATVDGESWVTGNGICYGNELEFGAKLRDRNTLEEIVCRYDWYIGTEDQFTTTPSGGMSVSTALGLYRQVYPNPSKTYTGLSPASGSFTQAAYNLLNSLITNQNLQLNKTSITRILREGETIIAVPIIGTAETTSTTTTVNLCSDYIVIAAGANHKNPSIQLSGEGASKTASVRIGLSQFNDLKNNSTKMLTIPVYSFKNSDQSNTKNLIKASDSNVYLIKTDDSSISGVDSLNPSKIIATLETVNVTPATGDTDYLTFKFSSGTISVKEGYTYKIEFHFNEAYSSNGEIPCDGVASFNLKIVPEYLTWTGVNGDNWNNDGNWRRSLKAELYKDANYTDDTNNKGFVPMNFSKVTIPNSTKAPWLYSLTGSPYFNMTNTNYTDVTDRIANAATTSIEYSLMVQANGTNYNCSNFYGNTCSQVYFKPSAEMRNTNYLTYNKAWVDFELTSGRWYMLSSPLKGVVAGDMYLPSANGKQNTEAFQSITYSSTTNNRFSPAIYQRSWDHSSSTVFKTDGNTYDSFISANWSQVYNKVDETYTSGKGFSIRPVYGTEGTDKVLFRIPKDDANYSYYSYDGSIINNNTTINRANNGKLAFENNASDISLILSNNTGTNNIYLIGNPFMATLDMAKFLNAHPSFERRFWILTGTGQSTVAIDNNGAITTSGSEILTGTVAPMQSFFVEKKSSISGDPIITFTPDMTIAKPSLGTPVRSISNEDNTSDNSHCLRIIAERDGYSSAILIKEDINASDNYNSEEDVPVLMDSNLADAPTLYSMAGNQAVSINVMSSQKTIPLGIYSENNNNVNLTFKGLDNFGGYMELYDALLNQATELNGTNASVTMPGNTHGRYYLNFTSTAIGQQESNIVVYSPERERVVVATSASDKLQNIKIFSLSGTILKELTGLDTAKVEILLPSGVYIIRVQSLENIETKKIACKQ